MKESNSNAPVTPTIYRVVSVADIGKPHRIELLTTDDPRLQNTDSEKLNNHETFGLDHAPHLQKEEK